MTRRIHKMEAKDFYETWRRAARKHGVEVDERWEDLTEWEQAAWEAVVSRALDLAWSR